jgi:phage baseplate assembly protein V
VASNYPEKMKMFRVGLVREQDTTKCAVRVTFPDRDQLQSWWLPVVVLKTQDDKSYWLPDVGEQVVCLMDEYDEDGAVIGAIYSSADVTPVQSPDKLHMGFRDGCAIEYDRSSHAMTVNIPNGGVLSISANGASISIDASGNVKIIASGQIQLGGGSPKGVARLGDSVQCPAGTGSIVSASMDVLAV